MFDYAIRDACAEASRYHFQLLSVLEPLPVTSSSPVASYDEYMDQCQKMFEDAKVYQRQYRGVVKLPTAAHIRQIGEYAEKHKLKVGINGYDVPSGPLMMAGSMICVQLRSGFVLPLSWDLDHEFGHVRDKRLIAAYVPQLKPAMKRIKWTLLEVKLNTWITMELMRYGLSQSDRSKFDRLRKEVVGDLDQRNVRQNMLLEVCFAELFRAGEEILDERYERIMGHPGRRLLKNHGPDEDYYLRSSITDGKGERVDLHRLACIAPLYEANLWEKFIRLPDYDTNSLLHIQPDHLEFFRLCVRGASRYFINTAAR